jgi:hypothetical protein
VRLLSTVPVRTLVKAAASAVVEEAQTSNVLTDSVEAAVSRRGPTRTPRSVCGCSPASLTTTDCPAAVGAAHQLP